MDASKPLNFFDSPMYLDQWLRAKAKEEKAKAERLRVEEKLSQLFYFLVDKRPLMNYCVDID